MSRRLAITTQESDTRLVTVYISQGPLGAEVVLSKLRSLGIPALMKYEALGRVVPVTVDGLGKYEVQVPPSYADAARRALEDQSGDTSASR